MRNNLGGGHLGAVPSDSSVELFDVLDSSGHKTGQTKPRHLAHRDGDWHRAVDIWIINPERGLLLQRRAADKDSWAGYWDISCGGHLTAGDDSLTGALRELEEELDLHAQPEELHFVKTIQSSARPAPDFINNCFNDLYWLETNYEISDFKIQTSELSDLKYVSAAELQALLAENPSPLVPHPEFYTFALELLEKSPSQLS